MSQKTRGTVPPPWTSTSDHLWQDPRFVIGLTDSTSRLSEDSRSTHSTSRTTEDLDSLDHLVLLEGLAPDSQPVRRPRRTFESLLNGPDYYFCLEDLVIEDEARERELDRLVRDSISSKPLEEPHSVAETKNKKKWREESVVEIMALPDVFKQSEVVSREYLNKRIFSHDSILDLRTLPDLDRTKKRDYNTESMEETRLLPILSSYWKKTSPDVVTAPDRSDDETTAVEEEKKSVI